jgi:hypothetical protein
VKAFGREVAIQTLASILAAIVVGVLATAWGLAPVLNTRFGIASREAFAWATALGFAIVVTVLLALTLSLRAALRERRRDSSFALTPNSGVKPSVTITNHGEATTYRVDARIVSLVDGTTNPHPAAFRCELHVAGITGVWDALLESGEWAHIILGSLEPVFPKSPRGVLAPTQSWTPIGHTLVIRRGKPGQHVEVPDAGAVVELTVHGTPQPRNRVEPKRFRVTRDGNTVNVTVL